MSPWEPGTYFLLTSLDWKHISEFDGLLDTFLKPASSKVVFRHNHDAYNAETALL